MNLDFTTITELAGDQVSFEQIERLCHRYYWVGDYCAGKHVLEVACGTGQGLGYLKSISKSLHAGDFSAEILTIAKNHYKDRISFTRFNAEKLPYRNECFDVIILFEAIYYIPSAKQFVSECRRVLRNNGMVLIATANKDLYDFNPSPHSYRYFGVVEFEKLFSEHGFSLECFGSTPIDEVSLRQKLLRPVKKLAVHSGLIPKTANGKKFLKRLVFGELMPMPPEIEAGMVPYAPPLALPLGKTDRKHKVIYYAAKLENKN